jgi:isoleucyl-tRNA synthetase
VGLIEDEVNVKEVVLTADVGGVAEEVLTLVHAALGPRLGPDTQRVTAAVRAGDWTSTAEGVVAGGVALQPAEYELVLRPKNPANSRTMAGDAGVVTLDTDVDDALEGEGLARDAVRLVQSARREAGLHVSDCITLALEAPHSMASAVEAHRAYVGEQTLAATIEVRVADDLRITVTKAPCPERRG